MSHVASTYNPRKSGEMLMMIVHDAFLKALPVLPLTIGPLHKQPQKQFE